ncbi:MAG: DUF5117 domain-containing protein [Planctomycetota bacterium]|nr:MAG: DUF5117 domain-containing protein [Planctomycetota bacterium]
MFRWPSSVAHPVIQAEVCPTMSRYSGVNAGRCWLLFAGAACLLLAAVRVDAQSQSSDYPPHAKVLAGFSKVISTADGQQSMYTLWLNKKQNKLYAELPRNFASKKYFIAMTIASGDRFAGLQMGDLYCYWRQINKRLALFEPNLAVRSTGDQESKASVKRLFTDRLVIDVPILTIGPGGGPVIDLTDMLGRRTDVFFGSRLRVTNPALVTVKKVKAFPQNVEIAFEAPTSSRKLQAYHYSISEIPQNTGYKPRRADERVGFFTTSFSDYGKYSDEQVRVRYINRWHIQKRDPKLKVSPPVQPIVFYIEHTTPVRYRRWIRQGILYWNKAFERIGISNAIEVEYQDAQTGRHMEKDPEDVRWNFIRWLNNDIGTAIGPSRVNPETGQILDADVVISDGWIRFYRQQFDDLLSALAMENFGPDTYAWLARHPDWDPRLRLAPPARRYDIRAALARRAAEPYAGLPIAQQRTPLLGDDPLDGLVGRISQVNGMCQASLGKAVELAMMRMTLELVQADPHSPLAALAKSDDSKIDGMPESFVGPLLAELTAHEVGHTLGLRHNFKASSIYSLKEINSKKMKGQPFAGSVMDYLPVNINLESGEIQGDYSMVGIGPYDMWAIEYGYSLESDLKPILQRVAEPQLAYATDEDTWGPDPLARRYDFSSNPLDYAIEQMRLVRHHRQRLLQSFVKEGESWAKARRGYELTLALQMRALSMMANWIGGAFVHRDRKGDKNARPPLQVVPAAQQRAALKFVLETAFRDEAYGLTPELLAHMTTNRWLDGDGIHGSLSGDPDWPVHDRIMGIQASTLTMLMNPTTLRRVYDNEFRVPADQDAFTLAELLEAITDEVWRELRQPPKQKHSPRRPYVSSLRRSLQQEHVNRLITLAFTDEGPTEAYKPISNLARLQLQQLQQRLADLLKTHREKLDAYTLAHVSRLSTQIDKALSAEYIYNASGAAGGRGSTILLLQPAGETEAAQAE